MEQSQVTFANYLMHVYETVIFHSFFTGWKADAIPFFGRTKKAVKTITSGLCSHSISC